MMRTRFYFLLLLLVASLVVVPEVKAHEAVPVGAWTATGNLTMARFGHTATVLGNGMVLVAGGQNNAGHLTATAELYDPTSGTWTPTSSMATARFGHTATVLSNGKVLVTGGLDYSGHALATAELYDPTNGTWTATGPMLVAHAFHTATLLNNGKVLVAGGKDSSGHATALAELYDPTNGTWTATGKMAMTRVLHTATLLHDGTVLVTGGRDLNGSILATTELYTPASGTWTATKNMQIARASHTATLLNNGKVLIAGGGARLSELYDPTLGAWTTAGSMATSRMSHTATLLSNGLVLVTGGHDNNSQALTSTELYNPASGVWSSTGSMAASRGEHTATLLSNGTVLVVGGQDNAGHSLTTAELFGFMAVPPTLQLPDPITVNATSAQGAAVTYTVTASNPDGSTGQIAINCTPAAGSSFPIGTTTVNCSAQDAAGDTGTGTFTVQVIAPDTTAPTLQLPTPITVAATSPQGATVTYAVSATDPDNTADQITINCTPASGSVFPVGSTTVNCSAQDAAGNTSTDNFPVIVQDVTPPTLQVPTTITVNATDTQGATVDYAVTATDPTNTPDQIVIGCAPLSGSVFPVGSTTVNCDAQDPAGNATTASFQVVVQDVTPPTLQMPVKITADATDLNGAVVNYTVTATDPTNTPDQITISCIPPSGSEFPIGTTNVVCSAYDPAGNTTTGNFQVVVSLKTVNVKIDAL